MKIKNSQAWADNSITSFVYALLGTAGVFFMRYKLHPFFQSQFPVAIFLINTMLISYKFGWRPGLLSAFVGEVLALYFFIPPFNSFELITRFDLANLVIYGALFSLIIYLIEKLQRESYRAVLISRVADSRMQLMSKLSSGKK